MAKRRPASSTALVSTTLMGLAMSLTGAALAGVPPKDAPQAVRVLYLRGMPVAEVLNQLRTRFGIAAISTLEEPAAVVLRDLPESIERSEALLREQGAVERAVDPHPPIVLLRTPETPLQERTFRFADADRAEDALLVLKVIYGAKQVMPRDDAELLVRDVEVILSSGEALFRELGFLAEAAP